MLVCMSTWHRLPVPRSAIIFPLPEFDTNTVNKDVLADMKKTVLHAEHLRLHARMVPFEQFDMPVQYSGILDEHRATRTGCTVFDTCHMGEFQVRGSTAVSQLENLLSCDVASLPGGRCRYGLMCRPDGGVLDDLILYRLGADEFMLTVNAGPRQRDAAWIAGHLAATTSFADVSDETAKIDLQGPTSLQTARGLFDAPLPPLPYYGFCTMSCAGHELLVSRTGYTGEIGLEIYCPNELAVCIWRRCLELGAVPAGLGARDTLRLEMGYPLYGHELSAERNAGYCYLTRAISRQKDFIGRTAICASEQRPWHLVGLLLAGRRSARANDSVHDAAGTAVGTVTSASFSPSLQRGIALAYVTARASDVGTRLQIQARRQQLPATVVKPPFYGDGTARSPYTEFA